MAITINAAWLLTTLLLSVRVAAATMLTSVLGPAQIPGTIRVLLAVTLGALLASTVGSGRALPSSVIGLALACLVEAAIGAAFALGFLTAYAATQIAGRILDLQMGFGLGSVLNPDTQTLSSLTGMVFGMAGVGIFLGLNGHHALIRALAASVEAFPPATRPDSFPWTAAPADAALMYTYGLSLAGPVMFALLLADITMAVFARSMPQLNIFVMGFALKVVLGMIGLAASVALSQGVFATLFGTLFRQWNRLAAGS
jgi:flagellar biosynthesis protein FliR